jgi:hypothetical protein
MASGVMVIAWRRRRWTVAEYFEEQRPARTVIGLVRALDWWFLFGGIVGSWTLTGGGDYAKAGILMAVCGLFVAIRVHSYLGSVMAISSDGTKLEITFMKGSEVADHVAIGCGEIAAAAKISYSPINRLGYGITRWWKTTSYTLRGTEGVILTLRDGKKVLVGTGRPDELLKAIGS